MSRRTSSNEAMLASLGPLPPVSSKAKDYSERPEEIVDELDDLRTRQIAKSLNKHFTDTAKNIAMEKAKADSALADLERRRAQTKAFVPSKSGELNPYDRLYFQLQQKRAECRRKEKETMMLYQRYVMKYGKSVKAEPLITEEVRVSPKGTSGNDHKGDSTLSTLDENSEINFSKFYEKEQEKQSEVNRKHKHIDKEEDVVHFMSVLNKFMTEEPKPKEMVEATSNDDSEGALPKLAAIKDSSHMPKIHSNLILESPPSATTTTTLSDKDMEDEVEDEDIHSDDRTPVKTYSEETELSPSNNHDVVVPQTPANDSKIKSFKCSELSNTNEFLKDTALPSSTNPSLKNQKLMEMSNDAPCFAATTVEGYDIDDRSIISELTTANSAVTRQLLDDVETEMEVFIKNEIEAIRLMLDSEEESSTMNYSYACEKSECSSSIAAGDESVKVAMKAEAMAIEMQKILDDLTKEDTSSLCCKDLKTEKNDDGEDKTATSMYPYKFEPAIPEEDWYVHFDQKYQKEFYVETKSKRTQWEYPSKFQDLRLEQSKVSPDEFLADTHSVASSRKSSSRRSSRRSLYRKQRRRRRARRLMVSSIALLCVLMIVFYWRVHHPNETVWGAINAFLIAIRSVNIEMVGEVLVKRAAQTATLVVDQFEYTFTDRKEREEAEVVRREAHAKAEKERKARERVAAAHREREEARRLAEEKAAVEGAARRREIEEAERLESTLAKFTVANLVARDEKEGSEKEAVEKEDQKSSRPWGCNIPFSYIIARCRSIAKTQPAYTEDDIATFIL